MTPESRSGFVVTGKSKNNLGIADLAARHIVGSRISGVLDIKHGYNGPTKVSLSDGEIVEVCVIDANE